MYLDHGVDIEMFAAAAQNRDRSTDVEDIPKPIVGYIGSLDEHKIDTVFIETLVSLLPQMSFVFVGEGNLDCSSLLAKNNVWMLGQKPYQEVPHYGKCFDVAIIPLRTSRWAAAVNPTKLKEYLALGKPIVSTSAFAELEKYHDVAYVADTVEAFAQCIQTALAEDNLRRIAARRKKVKHASRGQQGILGAQRVVPKITICK